MGHPVADRVHESTDCQVRVRAWRRKEGDRRRRKRDTEVEMGGVSKEIVETALNYKLNPTHLDVVDTSGGCGASFVVEIVSEKFEGKRLLERHRLVNAALAEEMKEIHALSIKTALTPEQWNQRQEANAAQHAT